MMKISIALCTYNGERFLEEQLNSFLEQVRLPDELIICDDCSTDKTINLVNEFKQKYPFPVYIYINEYRLGSTRNFEKAISLCSGDVIFLADQDDIWLPNKIELIEEKFRECPTIDLIFTNAYLVDEKGNLFNEKLWEITFSCQLQEKFKKEDNISEILFRNGFVTGATMAFRTTMTQHIFPFPNHYFLHDGWITLITYLTSEILPLDYPLIKYRQHNFQQIGLGIIEKENEEKITLFSKIFNFTQGRHNKLSRYESYDLNIKNILSTKNNLSKLKDHLIKYNFQKRFPKMKNIFSFISNEIDVADRSILHNIVRRDVTNKGLERIFVIVKELINRNYWKYSKGLKSAILDLIEK